MMHSPREEEEEKAGEEEEGEEEGLKLTAACSAAAEKAELKSFDRTQHGNCDDEEDDDDGSRQRRRHFESSVAGGVIAHGEEEAKGEEEDSVSSSSPSSSCLGERAATATESAQRPPPSSSPRRRGSGISLARRLDPSNAKSAGGGTANNTTTIGVVTTEQPKTVLKKIDTCVVLRQQEERRTSFLSYLYPPHLVALIYTCPVVTLSSLVGMISTRCKSQSEVFADRLQAKFGVFNMGNDDVESSSSTTNLFRQHSFPFPGTTFPPSRCCGQHFDFAKMRRQGTNFRSQPDLTPASAADLDEIEKIKKLAVGQKEEDDSNDSDLFFDFDIGSPDEEEVGKEKHDFHHRHHGRRAGSEESYDDASSSSFADKNSVAFGSTSSGLCSDLHSVADHQEEQAIDQELENALEMALDPKDWLAKRNLKLDLMSSSPTGNGSNTSSSTPIATQSPSNGAASPLISPDSLLDEPVSTSSSTVDNGDVDDGKTNEQHNPVSEQGKENDKSPSYDADGKTSSADGEKGVKESSPTTTSETAESFSIYTGSHKHTVASSKLNALIALLEKDREYARSNSSSGGSSPTKKPDSGKSSPTKRSYKCPLPTISDSPANFSFLRDKSEEEEKKEKSIVSASGSFSGQYGDAKPVSPMIKSDSLPTLTLTERELMQSPKTARKNLKLKVQQKQQPQQDAAPIEIKKVDVKVGDEDDDEDEQPKLRRASSLKSGKTPPGTPSRHKIVRFADVFGLDLADVKTFFDEIPKVPKSAYKDLKEADLSDLESEAGSDASGKSNNPFDNFLASRGFPRRGSSASASGIPSMSLVPMFSQPGGFPSFFDLLREKRVCLEEAFMLDVRSIRGTVRVQNIGFHKRVCLLYTTNEWLTQSELEATYIQGSCDGFSDKFSFVLRLSSPICIGQRLQFCLRYEVNNDKHWDNNGGKNYVFQCLGGAAAATASQNSSNSSSSKSSSSSRPIPQQMHSSGGGFGGSISHSPSAMSDDPWLRYL